MGENTEPRIIAFLCNWCTYTGADLAGTSRLQYPPNVRIIRLMCSGAVDPVYVLKPLLDGADGVLIGGCHPGDCHYQSGNYKARRRFACTERYIGRVGIRPGPGVAALDQRERRRAIRRDDPRYDRDAQVKEIQGANYPMNQWPLTKSAHRQQVTWLIDGVCHAWLESN